MIYKYGAADNYEDFASGRVIYGGKGIPNYPVRLITEIFGRAVEYSKKKEDLIVYDPCCGGAYSLTILGFFYSKNDDQRDSNIDLLATYIEKRVAEENKKNGDYRKVRLGKIQKIKKSESYNITKLGREFLERVS